jgi:glycosyltransferase involved in cell wall biosynthesis
MPTVSVIMPAYNVASYIGEAIASVLAQTHRDVELMVVDDGSTDSTAMIAAHFAARDSRVNLLRQPNGGISNARNHALRCSRGEFLAILDSDDVWEPEFLEAQLAVLRARPDVDIVTGNGWFLGSRLHGRPVRPTPDPRPEPTLASILADEEAIFIMSVMRRRVYETVGPFDESMRTNEDYDYWLRAAIAGFTFTRNDRPLAHYRRRDDSLSANEVRMMRGILRVYEKMRPRLADRPHELAILERQYLRFDTERIAAEARAAIETGDFRQARDRLSELYVRRGTPAIGVATLLAKFFPGVLSMAYQMRRQRLGVAP